MTTYLTFQSDDFALSNYMYKYRKRNNPNKGFHYNPLPFPAKFRIVEISPLRIFAKITAKFRLTQRKFASALTKFRGEISSNFRENKERKTPNFVCISFARYCNRLFIFGVCLTLVTLAFNQYQ